MVKDPRHDNAAGCPQIHAVGADKPFVDVLAHFLITRYGGGDLGLSRLLLLVPTRRSVPAVRQALLDHSGGRPMLLPRIQPLGDADLETIMPEILYGAEVDDALSRSAAIPEKRRALELARLVGNHARRYGGEAFSPDQSVLLAQALGDLIDDLERERIPFHQLKTLPPDDYAEHWQETIDFLGIIGEEWPARQREMNGIDPVARRNVVLDRLSGHWGKTPPDYPVIAAGTTGSIPATAALLRTIAALPDGHVILPGLDPDMPEEEWNAIGATHPQFGLKQLLASLDCDPRTVGRLDAPSVQGAGKPRMKLISEAMLPAALSHRWRSLALDAEESFRDFAMVEFGDGEEEAAGISLMLRDALENPVTRSMLVTHDRSLAQRVAIRLRRFGIAVEDTGGLPLLETRPALFLFAVLAVIEGEDDPVALLTLLKHPLCGLGRGIDERLRLVAALEKDYLRGVRRSGGLDALVERVRDREKTGGDPAIAALLDTLCDALRPARPTFAAAAVGLGEGLDALVIAAEALATIPEELGPNRLWQGHDGRQVNQVMAEIVLHAPGIGAVAPSSLRGILRSLLGRETYHAPHSGHPRIAILSPVEARMQHAELVILAGLNEESWPPAPMSDPWMSRAMREAAGLPPHERLVGMSAHDFHSLCSAREVILTRARKVGESPRLPSRWWQRLTTVAEALGLGGEAMIAAPGERWRGWVAASEAVAGVPRLERPSPVPPPASRPDSLSISDVELLLHNPYGLYARRILKLDALKPLDKEPGAAEFGTAIHQALQAFFAEGLPPLDAEAEARLASLLQTSLRQALRQETLPVFWRQRVGAIAAEVMRGEAERRARLVSTASELPLSCRFEEGGMVVTLRGRLDRLDTLDSGRHEIIDYKTGPAPRPGEVIAGRKPQLPLEGVLAEGDGRPVAALRYWSFARGRELGMREAGKPGEAASLIVETEGHLRRLLAHYAGSDSAYPCQGEGEARHLNDYEHLARLSEWQ